MTLEEKLQALRTATETLEPSAGLRAKLAATVEAVPLAPAGATATATATTVKVLFVMVMLGVVGAAFFSLGDLLAAPRWGGSTRIAPDTVSAHDAKGLPSAKCPAVVNGDAPIPVPEPKPVPAARIVSPPGSAYEGERETLEALRSQLKSRPFTCSAQQAPLEQILKMHIVGDAEKSRLLVRLAYLCPGAATPFLPFPEQATNDACDDSDWCHYPTCEPHEEHCARLWAALPADSCGRRTGQQMLGPHLCELLLRGHIEEAAVRTGSPNAWCLKAEMLSEISKLRAQAQTPAR